MSRDTLDLSDPTLAAAIADVERTFAAMRAAQTKFNRCSKPANREAARKAMEVAEVAYRHAAGRRDELVAQARKEAEDRAARFFPGPKRRNRERTQLTKAQQDQLTKAIWQGLDPNGAPIRLAELVDAAKPYAEDVGALWDFYSLVSDELQKMKRAGCVALQKGPGSGWYRLDRSPT